MNVEGEDADGHFGLGSGFVMAAHVLQADTDNAGHRQAPPLFGGDVPSSTHLDGGAACPPRVVPRSHARSVPAVGSHHGHHASGGHAPSPLGSLSQPASPTHAYKCKLSPGSQPGSKAHAAICAAADPAPAEALGDGDGAVARSQGSLTFAAPEPAARHEQQQLFGSASGSLQLPANPTEGMLSAPPPQAPGQPPPSSQTLASAASAAKRTSTQGSGASALGRSLQQVPSFGFALLPRASQQHPQVHWPRRDTTSHSLPCNTVAAELAAAGAAAAEAARLHLAADERHRRITAALLAGEEVEEETAVDSHSSGEESGSDAQDGAAEALGDKPDGDLGLEPSGGGDGMTDGEELALDDIQVAGEEKWYRRTVFWVRLLSLSLSLALFLTGIVCLVVWPHVKLAGFNLWRWCFFLGCWPPIYWASVWAVWALTKFCQWRLFAARTAVYFLVGTRGALMLVLRSCLLLAAFAALFQTQPDVGSDAAVAKVFDTLLRLLGCLALASVGNLVKKVLIKLMATHFHKEAHFQRMQEALRKEYFLSVLSQPRERRESTLDGGEGLGSAGGPRPKSFAKRWMSRNFVSKGVAAMHLLPARALRSFTARRRERSHSDPLLVAGARLSDAAAVSRGNTAGGGGSSQQEEGLGVPGGKERGAGTDAGDKPSRAATTALTGIRVVAGAGVEPTCRSMPNLGTLEEVLGGGGPGQLPQQAPPLLGGVVRPSAGHPAAAAAESPTEGWASAEQQQAQPHRSSDTHVRGGGGLPHQHFPSGPHQLPSRLSRATMAAGQAVRGRPSATDWPGPGSPPSAAQRLLARQAAQARQWPRQHTPRASEAAAGAPGGLLRASLASRRPSVASSLRPAGRLSTAIQAASRQGSLASLAGGPPPPLQQLLDLKTSPDQLRARNRRTSVVQMPPEELEKMHHIEKHIRKNQLKVTLVEQLGCLQKHSAAGDSNEQEARRVAFFLYHNLRASRRRNWVQQSDLEHFLPSAQAAEAFLYLDIDGNGRISASEIKASVVKIFQERAHLAMTLRDAKSVIATLERLLGCLIHTLFIFFYLAIFSIDVTQAWLTFSSIVLAFTFIFGNSIRTVFECVVWLFVVHPYDVGDTLVLAGENHRVEEIALLNTVLLRWDGARICAPNSRLNSEQLFNLSRSASKSEALKISLDMNTPLEVVEMLRGTVDTHVKANAADFSGASSVNVRAMGDPLKLVISVWYEYNHCGVDMGRCSRARTGLYMVLAAALNAAHVQFTLPPFPGDSAASRAHTALEAQPELASAPASALFGFGNKPAAAEQAAPPQDGPILIPYTPVSKTNDYSLRLFNAYPVAEVEYFRRDEGFFVLGSYMSGNNAADARCRETQPVVMCYSPDGSKTMRIHIVLRENGGESGGAALPPAPNNGDIEIAVAGGELVAVRQFEGNATQEACERCRQQLLAALQRDGLQLAEAEAGGFFRLAQYGPLHSLSTRMNEIWLAVKLG